MKTLIVKYLPSGENSNTKKLLDIFLDKIEGFEIEVLDLLVDAPPLHDEKSISVYYKRNYGGKDLTEEEKSYIAKQDKLKNQLLSTDILVMAYPMHNFGMPASVKAYLDAVIMKGETFDSDKKMMAGKKALTLYTSGGQYSDKVGENYPDWDTISALSNINFGFMGFDEAKTITAATANAEKFEKNLKKTESQIDKIIAKWYN